MNNRVCEILGCDVPIIEGGLAYVGNGLLAAEVSNGGGFGQIGSGGRTPEDLEEQIEVAISHTTRPFGVNIPISEHKDPAAYLAVIEKYKDQIKAVSLSAGNPRPYIAWLKERGLVVMTLASTAQQAVKAEEAGADIVVCEGFEAGGHDGPAELTTMTLVPSVVDAVTIPVVAAGGIADGRGLAAAFCLGAEGVQLGTRFVATVECQAHEHYKQALVAATTDDTRVIERSLGHVTRVLNSPFVDEILAQEHSTPGDLEQLLPMIAGKRNAISALDGDLEHGWLNAGQSIGLVHDIIPAGQLVQRLMDEMRATLQDIQL